MPVRFTDAEIIALLSEEKSLRMDVPSLLKMSEKSGTAHKGRELDINGTDGNKFRLILRQNLVNVLDFSVILGVFVPETGEIFRLRRYNGKSHEHRNKLENDRFFDYHIHMATERYQQIGGKEDSFAEVCNRYSDLSTAVTCLLSDCGFVFPGKDQLSLFKQP